MERKAEKFRAQIADLTGKLEQTDKALALTKDDYDRLHLAVSLDGGQTARRDTLTPQTVNEKLADKLITMEQVLANHRGLGTACVEYRQKIQASGGCPDSPEIWISKAARAELTKVKDALNKALELAQGTAPKRQRVEPVAPGAH
jgi:hypothetical protein